MTKTNKDVLLEAFPKVFLDKNGLPYCDPCHFGLCQSGDYCDERSCEDCRKDYWNKEHEGDINNG